MEKTIIYNCSKQWFVGGRFYRNHDLPAIVYMNNASFDWHGFKRPFNLAMQISYTGIKYWYNVDKNKKIVGNMPYKVLLSNGTNYLL